MSDFLQVAEQNLASALHIIKELRIREIFEERGFTCNLVGSVENKLLMSHLDIDFHVYSNNFSVEDSFSTIAKICKNPKIKEASYKNLLEAEDMCLEWHLTYEESPTRIWTIDIMHIKNESPYAGMIERVTGKIGAMMTEELREKILRLKWECAQHNEKAIGIEFYQAVIGFNINNYEEFVAWRKEHQAAGINMWEPAVDL